MPMTCVRPVTPAITTTATVSSLPTGEESPDTHWNNSSILLNPSGKIDIEVKWVDDSYGISLSELGLG